MTVKELREKLNKFDDNLIVMACTDMGGYFPILNVSYGFNEADGCVFLDNYEDDDENTFTQNRCSGCVYEDVDGSTEDIGNCVCCSRIVDAAKNDYYRKK